MILSLVAALDQRGAIGKDGRLPWHLSDDLKHFRRLTDGHHVLMGRKTLASIGGGLPGRTMIVLSRDVEFESEVAFVARSAEEAIEYARIRREEELFVVGGREIYALALPLAQRFYLTRVHTTVEADTYFPDWDEGEWTLVQERHFEAGPKNDHSFSIQTLERIQELR